MTKEKQYLHDETCKFGNGSLEQVEEKPNVVMRTVERYEVEHILAGGKFKLKKTNDTRSIAKALNKENNDKKS